MKLMINTNGYLVISRAGNMEIQECPYSPMRKACGHTCPLFSEPAPAHLDKDGVVVTSCIELCQNKKLFFRPQDFSDLRKKEV